MFYLKYSMIILYLKMEHIKVVPPGINNSCDENFFIFCMWAHYHIIYKISTKKLYVTRQIKKIWVSVWNEVWLVMNFLTQILRG